MAIAKTFKVDEADLFTWPGSGLRHDLREQVRLATPPALAALKAALGNVVASGAGATSKRATSASSSLAGGATAEPDEDDEGGARNEPPPRATRRRTKR